MGGFKNKELDERKKSVRTHTHLDAFVNRLSVVCLFIYFMYLLLVKMFYAQMFTANKLVGRLRRKEWEINIKCQAKMFWWLTKEFHSPPESFRVSFIRASCHFLCLCIHAYHMTNIIYTKVSKDVNNKTTCRQCECEC